MSREGSLDLSAIGTAILHSHGSRVQFATVVVIVIHRGERWNGCDAVSVDVAGPSPLSQRSVLMLVTEYIAKATLVRVVWCLRGVVRALRGRDTRGGGLNPAAGYCSIQRRQIESLGMRWCGGSCGTSRWM